MENTMYRDTVTKEVDDFLTTIDHFTNMQNNLGFSSVWSMLDCGVQDSNYSIFTDKLRQVVYECISPDATMEDIYADLKDGGKRSSVQVTSWAVNGSIKALWAAADSCIKQSGTHHCYIEDFVLNDDGTLELVTGS
jgi:hypothetical protein